MYNFALEEKCQTKVCQKWKGVTQPSTQTTHQTHPTRDQRKARRRRRSSAGDLYTITPTRPELLLVSSISCISSTSFLFMLMINECIVEELLLHDFCTLLKLPILIPIDPYLPSSTRINSLSTQFGRPEQYRNPLLNPSSKSFRSPIDPCRPASTRM